MRSLCNARQLRVNWILDEDGTFIVILRTSRIKDVRAVLVAPLARRQAEE